MEKLVSNVLVGKKGAVAKLYRELAPAVRVYLRGKIGREEDVEELLQDTFMSMLDSLPLYRGEAKIKTFILSIARHEVADWYRKRYVRELVEKTAPVFDGMLAEMSTPEWEMKKKRLKNKFYDSYNSLNKAQQDVISYRYELGMSVKDISKKMELSVKAAESLLYRARVAMRVAYDPTSPKASLGAGE